jgi:hypothetical protein
MTLFEKKGIAMSNSRVRQNPVKPARRKKIRNSRQRDLNP